MNFDNPNDLGLLQFGLGLLQASGPRPYRQTFGAGLAEGAQQGLRARTIQQELLDRRKERELERSRTNINDEIRKRLVDAQIEELNAKANRQNALADLGGKSDAPSDIQSALIYQEQMKLLGRPINFDQAYAITKRALGTSELPLSIDQEGNLVPRMPVNKAAEYAATIAGARATAETAGRGDTEKVWNDQAQRYELVPKASFSRSYQTGQEFPAVQSGLERQRLQSGIAEQEGRSGSSYFAGPSGRPLDLSWSGTRLPSTGMPAGPTPSQEAAAGALKASEQKKAEYKQNLVQTLPKARGAMKSLEDNLDNIINTVDRLKNSPGLPYITDIASNLPTYWIRGTAAFDAASALETLQNQIVVETMKSMKALSATGATGFGNMSEKEGTRLEQVRAPIKIGQTKKALDESLDNLRKWAEDMKGISKSVFLDEYGQLEGVNAGGSDYGSMTLEQLKARRDQLLKGGQ